MSVIAEQGKTGNFYFYCIIMVTVNRYRGNKIFTLNLLHSKQIGKCHPKKYTTVCYRVTFLLSLDYSDFYRKP